MSFWLKHALARASTRSAPDRIPLSAPRVFDRNYYSVTLTSKDDSASFLFSRLEDVTVHGSWWNGEKYADAAAVPLSDFVNFDVQFRYYLRQYEFITPSAARFALAGLFRWYHICAGFSDLRQKAYNRKSLVLRQRIAILRTLIDDTIESSGKAFFASALVIRFYGRAVTGHPDFRKHLNYYTLLLDSLVSEGLLRQDEHKSYYLEPKAFTALDEFEAEERRHEDSQKTQRSMKRITYVAGIATAIQGLAAWDQMTTTVATFGHWAATALGLGG